MPDRWVERPRVFPHKCAISGKGDIESGPYYEFPLEWFAFPADDAPPQRLYISAKYLRAPFDREDAPYRLVSEEEYERLQLEREELLAERDELAAEVEQLSQSLDAHDTLLVNARRRKRTPKQAPEA